MTFEEWVRSAALQLEQSGISDAKTELFLWLSSVSGKDRSYFLMHYHESMEEILGVDGATRLKEILDRRVAREPLAYIEQEAPFWKRSFRVGRGVLVPRQDSERVIEAALSILGILLVPGIQPFNVMHRKDSLRIMDLCTGSGCLGLTLAEELLARGIPCEMILTDISEDAMIYAEKNTEVSPAREHVYPILADLFPSSDTVREIWGPAKADLIITNPPYVTKQDMRFLPPEIALYEPRIALSGGDDGLDFYRRILNESKRYLCEDGYLVMEHGYDQGDNVPALCRDAGFTDVQMITDYGGNPRITVAGKYLVTGS